MQVQVVSRGEIGTSLYSYARNQERLTLLLNRDHPFLVQLWRLVQCLDNDCASVVEQNIMLLLLAAARSEASETNQRREDVLLGHRQRWSDTLATFLKT